MSNAKTQITTWTKSVGLGTLATFGILSLHHRWRKYHDPNAHWQDYYKGGYRTFGELAHRLTHNFDLDEMPCWVSGVGENSGHFAVLAIDKNLHKKWQTPLPQRVHDIAIQPKTPIKNRHIVVMGRRPSENFWVLNAQTGQLCYHIMAKKERHFYGHACFGQDGRYLYVTENNTANFLGKIGVYDSQNHYQKINEFDTYAIGPHALCLHPDGKKLVVANGGIKTEKASRVELNLDIMQPSLVYLDCRTGELLQQVLPIHHQMSIRHLAVAPSGLVVVGVQFQGQAHDNQPLLFCHQFGDDSLQPLSMPDNQWQRFCHYIASVAVHPSQPWLCATSPVGGYAVVMDLTTGQYIQDFAIPDCAGVVATPTGFLVSDGQGGLHRLCYQHTGQFGQQTWRFAVMFDNHLQGFEG